jgi:hypothetical protein
MVSHLPRNARVVVRNAGVTRPEMSATLILFWLTRTVVPTTGQLHTICRLANHVERWRPPESEVKMDCPIMQGPLFNIWTSFSWINREGNLIYGDCCKEPPFVCIIDAQAIWNVVCLGLSLHESSYWARWIELKPSVLITSFLKLAKRNSRQIPVVFTSLSPLLLCNVGS